MSNQGMFVSISAGHTIVPNSNVSTNNRLGTQQQQQTLHPLSQFPNTSLIFSDSLMQNSYQQAMYQVQATLNQRMLFSSPLGPGSLYPPLSQTTIRQPQVYPMPTSQDIGHNVLRTEKEILPPPKVSLGNYPSICPTEREAASAMVTIAVKPGIMASTSGHQNQSETEDDSHIGRWTAKEHAQFLEGYEKFGKDWKRIAEFMGTRSNVQCRTHAQKFFKKRSSSSESTSQDSISTGDGDDDFTSAKRARLSEKSDRIEPVKSVERQAQGKVVSAGISIPEQKQQTTYNVPAINIQHQLSVSKAHAPSVPTLIPGSRFQNVIMQSSSTLGQSPSVSDSYPYLLKNSGLAIPTLANINGYSSGMQFSIPQGLPTNLTYPFIQMPSGKPA